MTRIMKLATALFAIALITGCGQSKEVIGETVKKSMQQTFDTTPEYKNYGLKVEKVMVIKNGDAYKGMATIKYKGFNRDVGVVINVDGENIMWEAPPGSFLFLLQ